MDELQFKKTIAKNLIKYRKMKNLTQLEFATKLNYSDKAISKWERGESIPDVYTLSIVAEFYGITVNELLTENNDVTITPDEPVIKKTSHLFITIMSTLLVWLVATILFVGLLIGKVDHAWLTFIVAIPVSFIVLTVFSSIWYNHIIRCLAVSGLIWSIALSIHLCFVVPDIIHIKAYLFYLIAIPLEILCILWFTLRYLKKNKKEAH